MCTVISIFSLISNQTIVIFFGKGSFNEKLNIKHNESWQECRKIVICFPECNLAIYLKTVTMYVPSAPEIPHIEIWTQEESSHKPQNTRCSLFLL